VLIHELCKRYLEPWCGVASERLAGKHNAIERLPEAFSADLRAIELGDFFTR
jgi:hypothetical protein